MPANLQVPEGNVLFRIWHAGESQNYVCLPSDDGPKFVLFTPQAVLFDDADRQLATHYSSPTPFEDFAIRVTWQDSRDSSRVWGQAPQSSLLIQRVGSMPGPDDGTSLAETTFVQRVSTGRNQCGSVTDSCR